jgi:ubiquitin carboxyl-terminal hydrolase 14
MTMAANTDTGTASSNNSPDSVVVPIHIKWGKEMISLDVPTSILSGNSVSVIEFLQDMIQSKTNVPKLRQKLMCSKPKNLWKGILKENDASIDWSVLQSLPPSGSAQFLLMGTADEALLKMAAPPATKTIFIEDMKEEEIAAMADPAGLVNLGNTCYLNSVLQCLRVIPQFQTAIAPPALASSSTSPPTAVPSNSNFFINTLQTTYHQLSKQTTPVQPVMFVQATKMVFPQFAQLSPSSGRPMQQDAEEFYSSLLSYLATNITSNTGSTSDSTSTTTNANPIDTIFGIQLKETITCDEFTDPFANTDSATTTDASPTIGEPPVIRYDTARKLVCNIQGGGIVPSTNSNTNTGSNTTTVVSAALPVSSTVANNSTAIPTNVTFINEGIQLGLTTKVVKHSELLQRDAIWTSQQRIMKLPQVLTIQFGRFYWKLTPDSADHTGVKCKIMKPVAFHNTLDIYDFCTQDLQSVIQKSRQRQLAIEEEILNAKLLGKDVSQVGNHEDTKMMDDGNNTNKKAKTAASGPDDADTDIAMQEKDDVVDDDEEELRAALAMSMQEEATFAATTTAESSKATSEEIFGPGIPNDFLGYYELFAVVTHKGRDADGGHYMAWVQADQLSTASEVVPKNKNETTTDNIVNEDWYVFDDDEVSPCKTEDVLKLKGGGDWHMSYLNFYRVMKR